MPQTTPTLSGPTGQPHDPMDTIHPGDPFVVLGAGFKPSQQVHLERAEAGEFQQTLSFTADAQGKFSYSGTAEWGAYRFRAFTQRPNKQWTVAAETWWGAYA